MCLVAADMQYPHLTCSTPGQDQPLTTLSRRLAENALLSKLFGILIIIMLAISTMAALISLKLSQF